MNDDPRLLQITIQPISAPPKNPAEVAPNGDDRIEYYQITLDLPEKITQSVLQTPLGRIRIDIVAKGLIGLGLSLMGIPHQIEVK